MRFGIKDICIVSFIGVLTGRYIVSISRNTLDSLPFGHYLMGIAGAIAALFILRMVKTLIKQENPD